MDIPTELEVAPTELEMHRAFYTAVKAAGFESPEELLSAYKTLQAKYKALNEVAFSAWDHLNEIRHDAEISEKALFDILDMDQIECPKIANALNVAGCAGTTVVESVTANAPSPGMSLGTSGDNSLLSDGK